jgi:hypothetical protein
MIVARIKDGIIVNIEVADQSWVDENEGVDGCTFVPYIDGVRVVVGESYDPEIGFLPSVPPPEQESP